MKKIVSLITVLVLVLSFMTGTFAIESPMLSVAERPSVILKGEGESVQTELPSYFNASEQGWIVGVDDQLGTDVCWGFTQNNIIEANVTKKTGISPDYSEEAMKFETSYIYSDTGYTRYPNGAGHEYMSTAYLAAGGAVLERDMPFTDSEETDVDLSLLTKYGYLDHAKMFSYGVNMDLSYPAEAVAEIKTLIMQYGAVGTGIYYMDGPLYNDENYTCYYYNGVSASPNHAVTVIGWDDSFPASNFASAPAGDGAFIVKNSWGLFHNGKTTDLVYVSYYDKHITGDFFVSEYVSVNDLYDNCYQYDYQGYTQVGQLKSSSAMCISRFTAQSLKEKVVAASTYTVYPDTRVEVFINTTDGDPANKSAFKKVHDKTYEDAGYYLMQIEPQTLSCQTYAVAVRYSYGAATTEFPMLGNYAGLVDNSKNIPNTCYIDMGGDFSDVRAIETVFKGDDMMLCIKSFTENGKKPAAADASAMFTDIEDGRWYTKAVDYVVGAGIFSGTAKTTFEPDTTMSRAMFVRVLANISGVTGKAATATAFTDVKKNSWYETAVVWAHINGIVSGTSKTTFSPNDPVTREQMCAMLVRYADFMGIKLSDDIPRTKFVDDSWINNYAVDAVYRCQAAGIINGADGNMFKPLDSAARSHVASMLMNFCKNYVY